MRLGDDCTASKVHRHAAPRLQVLAWLALLCASTPAPAEIPTAGPRRPRLRSQRSSIWGKPTASTTAGSPARRGSAEDSWPKLGDQSKPLEAAKEEVLIGRITLEGLISPGIMADMAYCVKSALAVVASVPTSQISMSVTYESDDRGHSRQVVKFHFILLPVKGTSEATKNAIHESVIGSSGTAPFLVILTKKMRDVDALSQYYVLGLQYAVRAPMPKTERLDIWRSKDYGRIPQPGPTTKPIPKRTTSPPDPSACLTTYTPCSCAALGTCAWVQKGKTGVYSCAKSSYGSKNVPCSACPTQSRCSTDGCSEVTNACGCAGAPYGCRWDEATKACKVGSGTSCVACARQSTCNAAVPKIVSYMPLSGAYMKPQETLVIRFGFDRAIAFMDAAKGSAAFYCDGQVHPTEIARPRMKISINYLVLDVTGITPTSSSTNNARRCSLVIEEGLICDEYGVPFLGLRAGKYKVDFGDTVPPKLLTFSPKNGETGVEPTAVVTLTFSEPIVVGRAAQSGVLKVRLSRLEGGESLASVAQLELKPPEVKVENQVLKVDLNGKIEAGSHYTLSLPSGAVADREQNVFGGLAPRVYAFKTAPKLTTHRTSAESTGVPLSSLIAVGIGLIVGFGILILSAWWFSNLRAAHKRHLLNQQQTSKLSGARPAFMVDASGRSPSIRSVRSNSASTHTEDAWASTPKGQAPIDKQTLFNDTISFTNPDGGDPFEGTGGVPKLKRAGTWAPGTMPSMGQQQSEFPETAFQFGRRHSTANDRSGSKEKERLGSKERSASEHRDGTHSQASVRSAKEAAARQWKQNSEAKRRWHEAFQEAAAKRAAVPPGGRRSSTGSAPADGHTAHASRNSTSSFHDEPHYDPFAHRSPSHDMGPRSAGNATETSGKSRDGDPSSPNGDTRRAGSKGRDKASSPTPEARRSASHDGSQNRNASSPNNGEARRSSTHAAAPSDDPEVLSQQKEVERRMRALMDSPIADRKRVMRELMLEYHPDKNSDQNAKEIFQFINSSRGWFLCET